MTPRRWILITSRLFFVLCLYALVGCQSEAQSQGDTGQAHQDVDVIFDVMVDVSDTSDDVVDATIDSGQEPESCDGLFGTPSEATGLDDEQCRPECSCSDAHWSAPSYNQDFRDQLHQWTLVDAMEAPEQNPYETGISNDREGLCGLEIVDESQQTYRLRTFETKSELMEAGARKTHDEPCGLCSSLQDLAVYIDNPDLTEPVRACGVQGITGGDESQAECIKEIGFSSQCAEIWSWNTTHTREACFDVCIPLMDAPHNEPDGSMNDCLACDENNSGDVFKAVAGRTRRNSGLPSAICRPCSDLVRISHEGSPFPKD